MGMGFKDIMIVLLLTSASLFVIFHVSVWCCNNDLSVERSMLMLKRGGPLTLGFVFLQYGVRRIVMSIGKNVIDHQPGWSLKVYEAKVDRFGAACFKACYWLASTIAAYEIIKHETWLPKSLGGKGMAANCWADFGRQNHSDGLIWFYLVSFGYQMSDFFVHLIFEIRRPDFYEMLLHHVVALSLIFASFTGDFLRVGTLTIFLHGISDIFIYLCKAMVDTNWRVANVVAYATLYVSYAWCRLYVFPGSIMKTTWQGVPEKLRSAEGFVSHWSFFNFLLCTLFLLHVYWFGILTKTWIHLFTKGQRRDMVANLTEMDLQSMAKLKKKAA